MFTQNKDKLNKIVDKLINSYGSAVVYIDKRDSAQWKDRIAASIINDSFYTNKFTNTVIQCINGNSHSKDDEESRVSLDFTIKNKETLVSNTVLNYESCIALMLKLKYDGSIVSDIANIRDSEDSRYISVEEIDDNSDILRVSYTNVMTGEFEDEVLQVIQSNSNKRINEVLNTYLLKIKDCSSDIESYFSKVFGIERRYIIQSNMRDSMTIVYGDRVSCVIDKDNIAMTTFGVLNKANKFIRILNDSYKLKLEVLG